MPIEIDCSTWSLVMSSETVSHATLLSFCGTTSPEVNSSWKLVSFPVFLRISHPTDRRHGQEGQIGGVLEAQIGGVLEARWCQALHMSGRLISSDPYWVDLSNCIRKGFATSLGVCLVGLQRLSVQFEICNTNYTSCHHSTS